MQPSASATCLRLEGPLTVQHAEAIQETILGALDAAPSVSIDVSAVTEIDISFLQILVAANKTATQERKTLSIEAAGSEMLAQQMARCGLPVSGSSGVHALPDFIRGSHA